jgi:hypothetical protein
MTCRGHPARAQPDRAAFAGNLPLLWGDFVQTILKGALSGWLIGAAAAIATAIAIDRSPFPATRAAADRQFRRRPAHRRHRAHSGDVVRL